MPLSLASGTLDTSFGKRFLRGGGRALVNIGRGSDDDAEAVAIQPDGSIVVAGTSHRRSEHEGPYTSSVFALVRLNPDGTVDSGFGTDGRVETSFGSDSNAEARDLALQADGKIVVVGTSDERFESGEFALARYRPDGTLDQSFGKGGRVLNVADNEALGVAIQPDGRIVVVGGTKGRSDFIVVRLLPDGSKDPVFDEQGRVLTNFSGGGSSDVASDVIVQPDGKIVVVGTSHGKGSSTALARYLPDGALDPEFGVGGRLLTQLHEGASTRRGGGRGRASDPPDRCGPPRERTISDAGAGQPRPRSITG